MVVQMERNDTCDPWGQYGCLQFCGPASTSPNNLWSPELGETHAIVPFAICDNLRGSSEQVVYTRSAVAQ
eukprot:5938677-Heterocapsa_arctica.AAC.1